MPQRSRSAPYCFLESFKAFCWLHWLCTAVTGSRVAAARCIFGRVPGTNSYSDVDRHPENEPLHGVIAFRPEASLIYVNAESVLELVLERLHAADTQGIHLVVCDLSAAPYLDLAGSRMLHTLHDELASRKIDLRIIGAHGSVRDLLRADGIGEKVTELDRTLTLDKLLRGNAV